MQTNTAFRLLKENTEEAFFRKVAFRLAKEDVTPTDIFESVFEGVQEKETPYVLVVGNARVEYTCSVGYDRKEEYFEKVKKYNSSTKEYYYVDEKKTRTVTDWQAHSGTNQKKTTVIVVNKATQEEGRNGFAVAQCIDTTHPDCHTEAETMEIHANALQTAINESVSDCFYSVRLPGDHQKDKNYSGSLDITKTTGMFVPEYQMSYTYQDKTYKAKAFACGDMQEEVEFPSIAADVEKEAKEAVKTIKYVGFATLGVGVLLNFFMEAIGGWCLLGYGAAIATWIVHNKKKAEKMKSIYHDKKLEKKNALQNFLKKNNMKPLSEKENKAFE